MPAPASRSRSVIAVLALSGVAVSLMQTIVVPLLPRFPELLDTSVSGAAWLVTATLLAGAVFAPVLGRLGDMFGKRRMLLTALSVMTAGCALGAATDVYGVVLAGRVLQGTALGVIPLGISIMRDLLPPERVGTGTALMSSSLGIGGAVGLPLSGLVVQATSWQWLFAGAALVGLLQITLVATVVSESPDRPGGRFDLLGAVGLSAALICLLLPISQGTAWGWTSARTLGLLTAAAALFAVWGAYELRVSSPLVNLRVSAGRAVLLTNAASVLAGFAMFATFMVSAQMLQAPAWTGYGYSASLVLSGVLLLPVGVAMTVFSPVSARISWHRGPRVTLLLGGSVLVLGNLARAFLHGSLLAEVVGITIVAVGAALSFSALPTLIMQAVPPSETAAANSLNTLARTIGTSACSAVIATTSSAFTVGTGDAVHPSLTAYLTIFLLASGAAACAVLLAALIPGRAQASMSAPQPGPEPAQASMSVSRA